jgi:hypothetical protein
MSLIAVGSLAGLIVSVVAYSFYPLPATWAQGSWGSAGTWLSIAILAVGLVCFVAFIITGLVTVLNWRSDGPSNRGRDR